MIIVAAGQSDRQVGMLSGPRGAEVFISSFAHSILLTHYVIIFFNLMTGGGGPFGIMMI